LALRQLPDNDPRDPFELARLPELDEMPVDEGRSVRGDLEEEDRTLGLDLPRREERVHEIRQAAADDGAARPTARDRPHRRSVRAVRNGPCRLAAQHAE